MYVRKQLVLYDKDKTDQFSEEWKTFQAVSIVNLVNNVKSSSHTDQSKPDPEVKPLPKAAGGEALSTLPTTESDEAFARILKRRKVHHESSSLLRPVSVQRLNQASTSDRSPLDHSQPERATILQKKLDALNPKHALSSRKEELDKENIHSPSDSYQSILASSNLKHSAATKLGRSTYLGGSIGRAAYEQLSSASASAFAGEWETSACYRHHVYYRGTAFHFHSHPEQQNASSICS